MRSWWSDQPVRLLFTWARWLALRHPTIRLTNTYVTIVGALVVSIALKVAPGFNVTREMGLVQQVNGLLQALAPFFVAALALVSGFPGGALDRPMGAQPPLLHVQGEDYYPSRRELLGYLFAYLAGLSVVLYIIGAIVLASANPHPHPILIHLALFGAGWPALAVKGLYCGVLLHLLAVTLLGLHFLGNFLSGSNLARSSPSPNGTPLRPNPSMAVTSSAREEKTNATKNTPSAVKLKRAAR